MSYFCSQQKLLEIIKSHRHSHLHGVGVFVYFTI